MRRLLATLSLINVLAAIGLTAVYIVDDQPVLVLLLASGLALQGLFTVGVLGRAFGPQQAAAERLAILGSAVAVAIGVGAFGYGVVTNWNAADPEYGPMAVAILIAAHGAAALAHIPPAGARRSPAPEPELTPTA